jgi:hypothetical protein
MHDNRPGHEGPLRLAGIPSPGAGRPGCSQTAGHLGSHDPLGAELPGAGTDGPVDGARLHDRQARACAARPAPQ